MMILERPKSLADVSTHFCPGCSHGIVHRLVSEVMDELQIEGRTVGICPVGCAVTSYNYFTCDMIEAAHGRAPAVATGVKRANPDKVVFTYQGDGDLAAIGTADTPADPISGLILPPVSLHMSLPNNTPAAVPNANAISPSITILIVLRFRNASALVVAPTDVPSSMTTMYISALDAVSCS
jgi:hypothetical protein